MGTCGFKPSPSPWRSQPWMSGTAIALRMPSTIFNKLALAECNDDRTTEMLTLPGMTAGSDLTPWSSLEKWSREQCTDAKSMEPKAAFSSSTEVPLKKTFKSCSHTGLSMSVGTIWSCGSFSEPPAGCESTTSGSATGTPSMPACMCHR
eukprot:159828-Pyramimonas_sp.AAC.1